MACNDKMKIALINTFYSPDVIGGAEVIVQEQAQALSARGYEVFVICLGKEELVRQDIVSGIKVYRIPFSNRYWIPDRFSYGIADKILWHLKDRYNKDTARYISDIISSEKPELAICHNLAGLSVSVWDALSSTGVKTIQYVHDQYLVCLKSVCYDGGKYCEKPCLKCALAKFGARKKSSGVNGFVAVSNYVAERLLSLGYFRNVPYRVIHNARNLLLCSRRHDTLDVLTIGYIGAVSRVKGVHVLLEAFVESGIDARVLIAGHCGDKVYDEELRSMCGSNKRIEFLGYMNSADFYDRIDCLVIPSLCPDSFPTVAFESCAAGVPVVASNIGGLPEIVKDGVNGFLFEPGNVSALSGILRRLSDDRSILSALSANCPASVAEMTNPELMYDKLTEFIDDIR